MAELTARAHFGDQLRFDGQVAIITGAGSSIGLGRSYALLLASRGAKVLVNDIGAGPDGRGGAAEGAASVAQEIRESGGVAEANFDSVAERRSCETMVQQAMDEWGRVDILINNAGIAPFARFAEISDDDIERVVGVHLMGHIWMCRAVWPVMARQGYGRIVNVGSAVALRGMLYQSIYAAAKLGVVGLTRALASEGLESEIKANVILPAADTAAWRTLLEPGFADDARSAGLVTEAIAPVAAFLAHRACDFSGKIINARGGAVQEILLAAAAASQLSGDLTLESVRDHMPDIIARADVEFLPDPDGSLPPNFNPKPYPATTPVGGPS